MLDKLIEHKRLVIVSIIIVGLLISLIMYINYLLNLPEKTHGTEIDKSEEIYDKNFKEMDNIENVFAAINILENVESYLNSSENDYKDSKSEVLYSILDENYIDFYDVSKKNTLEKLNEYIGKKYTIKSIKYARTQGGTLVYLVNTFSGDQDYSFIIRAQYGTQRYSIIFPNYITEYGMENYVNNILTQKEESMNEKYDYNKFVYKTYSEDAIVKEYSKILRDMDFEYVYENYIGESTKNLYSKDQIKEFFYNEDSYFQRDAVVDLNAIANEDYTLYTYKFKDRKMNEYTIVQKDLVQLSIDFTIVEEEEYIDDGEGMLNIIEQ